MNTFHPEHDPHSKKELPGPAPDDHGEQVRIKILGITLIECKRVTKNVIILVALVLVLSIVLAWVLGKAV